MFRRAIAAAALIICLLPASALAGKPADTLDTYLKRVFEIFQDYEAAAMNQEQSAELKKRLSGLAGQVFDYRIMARMSLARHWRDFSSDQQEEFVRLFRLLLEENYFAKVLTYLEEIKTYTPEHLAITDEIVYSERKAEVQTVISYEGKEVPVNYRLVNLQAGWKIYDISVEGVSLVQNYRGQFSDTLSSAKPSALLERLRSKIESTGDDSAAEDG